MARFRQAGFTLVELVIVITVTAIVAVMVSQIVSRPLTGFSDQVRRTELVAAANAALVKMSWEIQNALPNSIRIPATNDQVLEFMPIVDAGRYRTGNAGNANGLAVSLPDNSFNHLGNMANHTGTRVVVYNTSATQLYQQATSPSPPNTGVITAAGNTVTISDCPPATCGDTQTVDRITFSTPHRFDASGGGSPNFRFYLTDDAVSYHCDTSAAEENLFRYTGYNLSATQVENRTLLSASASSIGMVVDHLVACGFQFQPGSAGYRSATVTIRLTLEDAGEQIELLKEVHIWNAP